LTIFLLPVAALRRISRHSTSICWRRIVRGVPAASTIALTKQSFGYEPPVNLLHDNRLNADVIEQVLRLFEEQQDKFVTLDGAQTDAAYRIPDAYIPLRQRTECQSEWRFRKRSAQVDFGVRQSRRTRAIE
jgi:hypothetical protein